MRVFGGLNTERGQITAIYLRDKTALVQALRR